jgi:hypothetical protein
MKHVNIVKEFCGSLMKGGASRLCPFYLTLAAQNYMEFPFEIGTSGRLIGFCPFFSVLRFKHGLRVCKQEFRVDVGCCLSDRSYSR